MADEKPSGGNGGSCAAMDGQQLGVRVVRRSLCDWLLLGSTGFKSRSLGSVRMVVPQSCKEAIEADAMISAVGRQSGLP